MNKYRYISLVAGFAGALALALPVITNAQTAVDTGAAVGIGATVDGGPSGGPGPGVRDTLKQRLQQNYENYSQNIRNNEDYRNNMMSGRPGSSTPLAPGMMPPRRLGTSTHEGEFGDDRNGSTTRRLPGMMDRRMGSSTDGENRGRDNEGRDRLMKVAKDIFARQQKHLVEQLTVALGNLKNIRARVAARIATETQNGKDMSAPTALLVTADAKITLADQAIQALSAFSPTSTPATTNASSTVDLGKPRQSGNDAIKTVNDARKALNDVVVAIAHALGFKLDDNEHASTTPQASTTHE